MNRSTWVIIIVACIVIIGLIWIFNRGVPDTSPPQMPPMVPGDPNQSHWIGYNTWVIVDPQTHCQYLATSAGGIVQRDDGSGKQVCHMWGTE